MTLTAERRGGGTGRSYLRPASVSLSFNKDVTIREECLAHGGGKRSQELVNDFLGRDIKPAELATSLIDELDTKIEVVEQTIRSK